MRNTKRVAVFALASLFMVFVGLSIAQFGSAFLRQPREISPWQILLSVENQNLENLSDKSGTALQQAIDAMTGRPDPHSFPQFAPRLFSAISNTNSERRYILVEEAPLVTIPSESRLRVHLFDTAGNLLSGENFAAGWRTRLTGMNIRNVPEIEQEALVVSGEYCLGGHPSRQYYMVVGNRISLAYLEQDGKFDRNDIKTRT